MAAFHIDLLADHGVLLGEPYTRQLCGKLRESAEIKRARRAMERCVAEAHTVDEEGGW